MTFGTPGTRGGAWDVPHNATLRAWHRGVLHLPNRRDLDRDPTTVRNRALGFRCARSCFTPAET